MPASLAGTGITTIAADASRQPQVYTLGPALTAPRYPSNIYYNAANWPDQLNEYNTLYVQQGISIGTGTGTGHCAGTTVTTCRAAPAAEADVLASESHIMLGHVLANDPRVGYAHQSNLIGPATQNGQDYGYTILSLINAMLSQYNAWYTSSAPLDQLTDVTSAQVLARPGRLGRRPGRRPVHRHRPNGTVTITNNGAAGRHPGHRPGRHHSQRHGVRPALRRHPVRLG